MFLIDHLLKCLCIKTVEVDINQFIFGAKAASSYYIAKDVIHLINCISTEISNRPELREKINKEITTVTGMYDVFPTLSNMFGVENSRYALGHDVFSNDDHFVIFPKGNWITDKMYYDSQNNEAITLDENATISSDYIDNFFNIIFHF